MARIKNSPFEGMSGTLGDLVFRTWGGKTVVYAKPRNPVKQSAAQKANRSKFSMASERAKEMLMDNDVLLHYKVQALRQNLPNAYTAALREELLRIKASASE